MRKLRNTTALFATLAALAGCSSNAVEPSSPTAQDEAPGARTASAQYSAETGFVT